MDPILLNTNLEAVGVIDTFDSFIWTDKYNECGDFELIIPISAQILTFINLDYYLTIKESEHLMIIEKLVILTDPVNGNKVKISGRSLETILGRRIIWNQTLVVNSLQGGIALLLANNAAGPVLFPTKPERQLTRLVVSTSTDEELLAIMVESKQYLGQYLYDVIKDICVAASVGFKLTLNENDQFVFQLYLGVDRSYDQDVNPYVAFTPKFTNLIQGTYTESTTELKTVALVYGEGEGPLRKTAEATIDGGGSDLSRREMYVAGGISQTVKVTTNGVTTEQKIPDLLYIANLKEKGLEVLAKNTLIKTFEGQLDSSRMYKYREDFFLGDIVQMANEYGHEAKTRVTEVIHSEDSTGTYIYPVFGPV